MDLKLNGKLALVTGSTSGIGEATAKALAAEGCRVIVNGRSQKSVDGALGRLGEGDFHGHPADVSTADGCTDLINAANKLGRVDILVNNAGIFAPGDFAKIPDGEWMRFYEVNVMSGIRMSRGLVGPMKDAGWGRIIFVSSESGQNIPVEMIHYGMTKTAQLAISRGLAKDCKGTGVTVNSVQPGPTWSPGVEEFVEQMAEQDTGGDVQAAKDQFFRDVRPGSLIQRFSTCEEVAGLITYLCGELAGSTTGAAVKCDGGIVDTVG